MDYFPSPISIAERMFRIETFAERVGKPAPSWGYSEWCISNCSDHAEIISSFLDIVALNFACMETQMNLLSTRRSGCLIALAVGHQKKLRRFYAAPDMQ